MGRWSRVMVATVGALACSGSVAHAAFDPAYEAKNFSKIEERGRYVVDTPAYQQLLRTKSLLREAQVATIQAADPERIFQGQLCWQKMDGCAGEVRAYDWASTGAGLATPVSWVARNGSVISGHVFATPDGPANRPGAVLTTGSVQAPEELYWAAAQALAKAGYVVLTWDVQGQGFSDTPGEGADRMDGVPSQNGQPFYDQTEDALDFFFSDAAHPYAPRPSCSSGTSHVDKQQRRVAAGLASSYDPFATLLDPTRVGIFGHSLGASAVSYIGQLDPRVKAIVAYDNLTATPSTATAPPVTCTSKSSPRPAVVTPRTPALGISNDYGLTPQPNTSEPDPDGKTAGSKTISKAGVDTMELVVRGGTHYESSIIPNTAFGGTYRGNDMEVFYTVAWFDRYVKGDPGATTRLLTNRWLSDKPEAGVDPDGDGNLLSKYYRSRIAITGADGSPVVCESVRTSCPALAAEGSAAPYDAIAVVQAKGAADGPGLTTLKSTCSTNTTDPVGATGAPPAATTQKPACAAAAAPAGSAGAAGASGAAPAPAPGAVAACRDAVAPVSRFVAKVTITRKGVRAAGRSSDTGCGGAAGRVAGVTVAFAKVVGKRCAFLRANGRFGPGVSCLRTSYVAAAGTSSWSFTRKVRLAKGRYKLFVRGVDTSGNVERKAGARTFRALRLR